MTYCINPKCKNSYNPDGKLFCCNCGSELLLEGRYRVVEVLEKRLYTAVYEVIEKGEVKILKVLEQPHNKLVELFEKEAKVLHALNHSGIPKGYGYFQFQVKDKLDFFPCIIMEKIEGLNLQQYVKQRDNRPIKEELAVEWLFKLVNILDTVHEEKLFHRDIKPSNIMLRSDGELVLIDFGSVREITDTYPEALAKEEVTTFSSRGYTAPEQYQGQAVPQSDFFALGRTFVYLLTGVEPHELPPNSKDKEKKVWRDRSHISDLLADFIDNLMDPLPENRPIDTKVILQKLIKIKAENQVQQTLPPQGKTHQQQKVSTSDNEQVNQGRIFGQIPLIIILVVAGVATTLFSVLFILQQSKDGLNSRPTLAQSSFSGVTKCKNEMPITPALLPVEESKSEGCNPIGDNLSFGEEILTPESGIPEKQEGIKAYAAGQYKQAVMWLQKARQKQLSDPEVLIYLNNAWIEANKVKNTYTIAVAVPLGSNPYIGTEILRGVAHAQNELVNDREKIPSLALKILIADDANNSTQAQQIAKDLTSQRNILAVIGHYTSEITLSTIDIYEKQKLVQMSSASTSTSLPRPGNKFFFRTVPTERINAQRVASHLNEIGQTKAAIFYNSKSNFSRSSKEQFVGSFSGSGRQIVDEFNLSDPFFNPSAAIDEVQKKGATALVIIPDGGTSRYSFSNAIRLIQANQGRFWMMGATSLESQDVLLLGKDVVDRLVITVPWMAITSPNQEFPKEAQNLWKGGEVGWLTASAYDATQALIKALETTPNPNRQNLQQTLSKDDFKAQGATGTISFVHDDLHGDRKEDLVQSAKIVRSPCPNQGNIFVPIDYEQSEASCK